MTSERRICNDIVCCSRVIFQSAKMRVVVNQTENNVVFVYIFVFILRLFVLFFVFDLFLRTIRAIFVQKRIRISYAIRLYNTVT